MTHVQALVAHALSRQGKGWFEERLGTDAKIEWFVYNAGPSAMEAIFANSIDLTYVGPSPAINAYAKSRGEEIRIVAGAANGGAALVVRADRKLKSAADFRGKKIATPQLGNTQDISCRAWLAAGGLKITQLGGDAQVLPTANPDQLPMFQQKQDRRRMDGGAVGVAIGNGSGRKSSCRRNRFADHGFASSSAKFLERKSDDLAKKFVEAHRALTDWIVKNGDEAQKLVVDRSCRRKRRDKCLRS